MNYLKTDKKPAQLVLLSLFFLLILAVPPAKADDLCIFGSTADDVPPNIVILLENGAEMEQIVTHDAYNKDITYSGAFNDSWGYGMAEHGGHSYLVEVKSDLTLESYSHANSIMESSSGVWTINGKSVTLPVLRSTSLVNGVKDNNNSAGFRYTANYLNWIFYAVDGDGDPRYTGNDSLPSYSNFYMAKKAIFDVARLTANRAQFGLYNFNANASGASNAQPLKMVVNTPLAAEAVDNTLDSAFVNNVNNMSTVLYSPLAEGLARVGGYYASPSSHVVGAFCQKNFVIVVSPGLSSEDLEPAAQSLPAILGDYDNDSTELAALGGEGWIKEVTNDSETSYPIPANNNGSSFLDDVADYLYGTDVVDYQTGFQNVITYTVGFMSSPATKLFMINTSNNGNGNPNLYDTTDLEYGKYHFEADNPDNLSVKLMEAIIDILSRTTTFTAPVVPVTRTTSGSSIYLALFKPAATNFWEGNVVKLGINSTTQIVDANGDPATYANGALKEDINAFWETKHWADPAEANYIHNANRQVYTYFGASFALTDADNAFSTGNPKLTEAVLGSPNNPAADIINYIRGADAFDEDSDADTNENRTVITGDVLHSEPLVVTYNDSLSYVFFGANDGMLHAVRDADGVNVWSFITPDHLPRLKNIVEGAGHQSYVDSSPKSYILDLNHDYVIDPAAGDRVILACGERKGGSGYFALDVTLPESPQFLWRIDREGSRGTMELNSIIGAFQDNEVLLVSNRHAAANGQLDEFLKFEEQESDFAVGTTIRGGASGATATVSGIDDFGDYGVLSLDNIVGAFQNDEDLVTATRYATTDSALLSYLYVLNGLADFSDFLPGSVITGSVSSATATVTQVHGVTSGDPTRAVVGIENRSGNFSGDPVNEALTVNSPLATANGALFDFIRFKEPQAAVNIGARIRGELDLSEATVASLPSDNIMELTAIAPGPWPGGVFWDNESLVTDEVYGTASGSQFQYVPYRNQPSNRNWNTNKDLVGASFGPTCDLVEVLANTASSGLLRLQSITAGSFADGEGLLNNTTLIALASGPLTWGLRYNLVQTFNVNDIVTGATSNARARVISIPMDGVLQIEPLASRTPGANPGEWILLGIQNFINGENLIVSTTLAKVDGTLMTQKGLRYDNSIAAFKPGDTVVGALSGASGVIATLPVAGVIEFVNVVGAFVDNENLMVQKSVGQVQEQHDTGMLYKNLGDTPLSLFMDISGALSGAGARINGITLFSASTGVLSLDTISGVFQADEDILGLGLLTAAQTDGTVFTGLRYDDWTAGFINGGAIRGAPSNATATVNETIAASVVAGILKLSLINGSFLDNDNLLDNVAQPAAVADGGLSGTILNFDNQTLYLGPGSHVTGATSGAVGTAVTVAVTQAPTWIVPQLGQSWAEPKFGLVNTTGQDNDSGTPVFFIGGGYSDTNANGKAILAINVLTGATLKLFDNLSGNTGNLMNYSLPSTIAVVDENGNGIVDKLYVGDMGGNLWRVGKFTMANDSLLPFPENNELISTWSAQVLFHESTNTGKFFYPPVVTLEKGYDLVFAGTGDRDDACINDSIDRIYAIKDRHWETNKTQNDLVNALVATPNLDGNDSGWYIQLAPGEKVLSEGVVFFKVAYFTTFIPSGEACTPGGTGRLYALDYKTAAAAVFGDRSLDIGGGIPSKPVLVIPPGDTAPMMFISVGSTNPDESGSTSVEAGIIAVTPNAPLHNFFYIWWRDMNL